MENNTGPSQPTTPITHPSSNGLENAVSSAVDKEFKKRGFNNGGGGDDTSSRLRILERDMAVIKETMVTKEFFIKEMSNINTDIFKEMGNVNTDVVNFHLGYFNGVLGLL